MLQFESEQTLRHTQVLVNSPNESKLKCHPFSAAFCDCSTALFHKVIWQFVRQNFLIWGFYFGVLELLLLGRTIEARRGVELHMNDGKDDNSDLVHQGQFETFPKIHPFWRVGASLATLFI